MYNNEKLKQNVDHQFLIVRLTPESIMYLTNICNNLLSVECLHDIKMIYRAKEH